MWLAQCLPPKFRPTSTMKFQCPCRPEQEHRLRRPRQHRRPLFLQHRQHRLLFLLGSVGGRCRRVNSLLSKVVRNLQDDARNVEIKTRRKAA